MKKIGALILAMLVLTGCQAQSTSSKSKQSTTQQSTTKTTKASPKTIKVSLQQATKAYQDQFGKKAKVSEISLERKHGQYQYEVSGLDNRAEYELNLNAKTGKVLRHERETLEHDTDDRTQTAINVSKLKSLAVISKAATTKVGGGMAVEWSLDHDNQTPLWEVDVTKAGQTSEVQVNAYTGKVVTHVSDDDDNDED